MKKYKYLTSNYKTVEELKKHYRELSREYHPDLNPDGLESMKVINNEFEELFPILNKTEETAKQFIDIINNIIHLDITIEIVGNWIWCSGSTYNCKDILKENGFKWAPKKKMWYFNPDGNYKKRSKKELSISEIKGIYGSDTIKKSNKIYQIA